MATAIKQVLLGGLLAAFSVGSAVAGALTITAPNPINNIASGDPDPTCWGTGTGTDGAFITASCPGMASLTELYKFDGGTPSSESGTLADSYSSFLNGDQSGGTITWDGTSAVSCVTSCWLLVKDGNNDPGRYAYNLTGLWDGVSTITLTGFWPAQGGISHWALYGNIGEVCTVDCDPDTVPEPTTLALVGLALVGAGLSRRRRRA